LIHTLLFLYPDFIVRFDGGHDAFQFRLLVAGYAEVLVSVPFFNFSLFFVKAAILIGFLDDWRSFAKEHHILEWLLQFKIIEFDFSLLNITFAHRAIIVHEKP
jgi:hypothetical protein